MALTLADAAYAECEELGNGEALEIALFKKRYGTGGGGRNETCAHNRPDGSNSRDRDARDWDGDGRPGHAGSRSIAGHRAASCTREPVRENALLSYHDIIIQRPRWLILALVAVTFVAAGILTLSTSGAHPYSLLHASGVPVHLQGNSPDYSDYGHGGAGYSNDRSVPIRAGQIYEVKRGDTIWSIAISLNRGSVPKAKKTTSELEKEVGGNVLFPGESVRIPTTPSG